MPDTLAQVKIRKTVKEGIEVIQKRLLKAGRNEKGWIIDPQGWALFSRDPSIGDIIEQAVTEWREKHKL